MDGPGSCDSPSRTLVGRHAECGRTAPHPRQHAPHAVGVHVLFTFHSRWSSYCNVNNVGYQRHPARAALERNNIQGEGVNHYSYRVTHCQRSSCRFALAAPARSVSGYVVTLATGHRARREGLHTLTRLCLNNEAEGEEETPESFSPPV